MKKPIVGKLIAFTIDKEKQFDMLISYQELAEVIHNMKAQGAKLEGCWFLNNEIKMKVTPPSLLDKVFKLVFTPMDYQEYRQAEFQEAVKNIDRTYKPFVVNKNYPIAKGFHDAVSLPTPAINLTQRAEEMRKQQKESNIEAGWEIYETPNQKAVRLFQQRNKKD